MSTVQLNDPISWGRFKMTGKTYEDVLFSSDALERKYWPFVYNNDPFCPPEIKDLIRTHCLTSIGQVDRFSNCVHVDGRFEGDFEDL